MAWAFPRDTDEQTCVHFTQGGIDEVSSFLASDARMPMVRSGLRLTPSALDMSEVATASKEISMTSHWKFRRQGLR